MNEFDIIAAYFAPLTNETGAHGLMDDVAEINVPPGQSLIVTTDTLVEGVHFFSDDPLETVGRKLVRVNVSDIFAKGGAPKWASLALTWPASRDRSEIEAFANGLGKDLAAFGISLVGGDTTSTPGPLTLSLTLHGLCSEQGPIRRSGARVGDDLWVSGCIGDGFLGLKATLGQLEIGSEEALRGLVECYRVPSIPDKQIAELVSRFSTASLDISDGLLADADHLAVASGVRVNIDQHLIPLSDVAKRYVGQVAADRLLELLSGGDDYQALFCVPETKREAIESQIARSGLHLTRIGNVVEGTGVYLKPSGGGWEPAPKSGWKHFK